MPVLGRAKDHRSASGETWRDWLRRFKGMSRRRRVRVLGVPAPDHTRTFPIRLKGRRRQQGNN